MLAGELLYLIDELAEIGQGSALPFRRLKPTVSFPAVMRQAAQERQSITEAEGAEVMP
jgi:hypothetical protein